MCNVACAVTVEMEGSLGWQCSVLVKVSVTLSCVVIVIGLAHAVPTAAKAKAKAAANASVQSTIFVRCKARSMRLSFPFVCLLSLLRTENSKGGGVPKSWEQGAISVGKSC